MIDETLNRGGSDSAKRVSDSPLYLILPAGGSGTRMGGDIPKQFLLLGGIPVFMHCIRRFLTVSPSVRIIIVTHPDYIDFVRTYAESLKCECIVTEGGRDRLESVRNGLKAIPADIDAKRALVAVHDAARPFLTERIIKDGLKAASLKGAAVPTVPLTDSIREITPDGDSCSVERARYRAVQTPQIFRLDILRDAYAQKLTENLTDDASVVEAYGYPVSMYEGDTANFKLTNPIDLLTAEAFLKRHKEE